MADLSLLGLELSRVLRKGERLILSDFHPAGLERGWRRTFRHAGEVLEIANFRFSVDHLCSTFREHGLDEIRAARSESMDLGQIYSMVTESAADVLQLQNGEGKLQPGSDADLLVVKRKDSSPAETLLGTRLDTIEMVMVSGKPHLVSASMAVRCPPDLLNGFEDIEVEGTASLVRAPVRQLLREPLARLGANVRLAGKRVSA